jgi:hypothetical protein
MATKQVYVPPTKDQGATNILAESTYFETVAQNALWLYNKNREHDGKPPLSRMPKGTRYESAKKLLLDMK